MATLISPYQYFADPQRARPIFNGFIYIGRLDGDPTNPDDQIQVSVICECGGAPVNVTQPIRTGPGGVPIYNGSPAQINIPDAEFSITVQDKDRVQVYHSPRVRIDSNTTAINLGAVGDGVTNDQTAFDTIESNDEITSDIDLLGRIYVVDSIPTEKNYINGIFRIGAVNYTISTLSVIKNKLELTVGPSGDFDTINNCIDYITTNYSQVYLLNSNNFDIRILPNYVMRDQVICNGVDLSHITITTNETSISIDDESLTTVVGASRPAFSVINGGSLPLIDVLFDMGVTEGDSNNRHGIYVNGAGSSVTVNEDKGVINSAGHGLYVLRGASATATGSNFSSARADGIRAEFSAIISAPSANCNGCGTGFNCARGSSIVCNSSTANDCRVFGYRCVQSSLMDCENGSANNAGDEGLTAQRSSNVNAEFLMAMNCTNAGINCRRGSFVEARGCNLSGGASKDYSIRCHLSGKVNAGDSILTDSVIACVLSFRNSFVDVRNCTITNSDQYGLWADRQSTIHAESCTVTGCDDHAIYASRGSNIGARSATATGSGGIGLHAQENSRIDALFANVSGASSFGVRATFASNIAATNVNARKGSIDSTTDVGVLSGSTVDFSGSSTGGVSQAINILASTGIIYRNV